MANKETGVPPKSEKASSPDQAMAQEQPATHPYPDWAAMQAYYGPGMVPPPYFGTAVAPGHAPHPYMWSPQPMIPPFGSPYTAIYPHGLYPHPALSLGSHAHCQGVVASATTSETVMITTPLSMEMPKSSGNREKLPTKRLKAHNGQSTCNGNTESIGGADGNAHSQSEYNSTEGSSDGSDGNNAAGVAKGERKQSSEAIQASGKLVGTGPSPSTPPKMEVRVAKTGEMKAIGTPIPTITGSVLPAHNGVPAELWMQDDRELKRERRKQSNRESARRSRLRKQTEAEELAAKVESLNAENMTLRSEINRLKENSDKLMLENSALVEKLKGAQPSQAGELSLGKLDPDGGVPSAVVGNIRSIIDNSSSINCTNTSKEDDNKKKPAAKLRQLLDTSPRTNAVAAS